MALRARVPRIAAAGGGGGSVNLAPVGIVTGEPVLGTPSLTQSHALAPASLATGAPVLGTPNLAQNHALAPVGLVTGAPNLGQFTVTIGALAPVGIVTGAPVLGAPSLTQSHSLAPVGLVTGAPVLGALVLNGGEAVEPSRRRRGAGSVTYYDRWEKQKREPVEVKEAAPSPLPAPETAPIVPGGPTAQKRSIVARDLRDLGRVLGFDARSLEAARRQTELEEDDEDALLLLL